MKPDKNLPYVIFEVANVHGGNRDKLLQIVNAYKQIDYPKKAIKFQPLKPEQLALPDYQWFGVYQELYFEPHIWSEVIETASEAGGVWLDIFDAYGVEILNENKHRITGIKLQTSVLDNFELISAISAAKISQQLLLINVSGHEVSAIEQYIAKFSPIDAAEIILQTGFQSYPTAVSDTGLQKIPVLSAAFPGVPLCIADHAPAEMAVARQIPVWATLAGCTYVEKHFCISRADAKYDYYSALEPGEFHEMLASLHDLAVASHGHFISVPEENYLKKSYQAPIARHELVAGRLIGLSDLYFRRTNQQGLTWAQIVLEQSRFSILARTIQHNATPRQSDYKKANIGVIVACRMKSSRLKEKAILPIHGVSSVERCLRNCLQMKNVDQVVLATSTVEEDQVLENYTLGGLAKFYAGEPEDVIRRYLGACDKFGIDVIVRVTADCPVVSPEITEFLLKSHFETGADYTAPIHFAVGSSPEIYNTEALRRVITLMGKAEYSEYMTWYMKNNADIFNVNLVDIPIELQRNYRLTLDYPEDLEMFERLYATLDEKGLEATLMNVFSVLDSNVSIAELNQHLTLSYKTDAELINKLNEVTRIPSLPIHAANSKSELEKPG